MTRQRAWLLLVLLPCLGAQRLYFRFDTRSGDYQLGPDGSVPYTGIPDGIGTVTVSSGTTTVNGQTVPRGMQIWTVGTSGWYDIVAAGASGADYDATNIGGKGVAVKTRYYLAAGTRVIVLVGAKSPGCSSWVSAGGGGGSFVSIFSGTSTFSLAAQHTLLLAAGGGGGTGQHATQSGVNAVVTTSGALCRYAVSSTVSSNGGGGGGGALAGGNGLKGSSTDGIANGGGGGGFIGNGGDGWTSSTNENEVVGGKSFLNGGVGGWAGRTRDTAACPNNANTITRPPGGFGGGGPSWYAAGGGGGYSGGQASGASVAGSRQGGGGGGSYDVNGASNAGTLYTSWDNATFGPAPAGFSSGYMSSDGIVAVSLLACPSNTRPSRDSVGCVANPGFYIGSAGTRFPPSPYMSGPTLTVGSETFTVSSSSNYPTEQPWKAFSNIPSTSNVDQWSTSVNSYSGGGNGAYAGAFNTLVDGNLILGEWLQLQSTTQRTLGLFSITASNLNPQRSVKSFVLAGSNDGSVWSSLQAVSDLTTWTANLERSFTVPVAQAFTYFRLIVTNITATSAEYLSIDEFKLFDAQVTACTGSCAIGTTKFCSPDGATVYCCTSNQYFISGISTACVTCPANSAPDSAYQERCLANTGYFGPTLYMFDGSTPSYRNLGSKVSHTVSPVGWRPTFSTVASRTGAYFDSSINGNYYVVSNDYNTITLAFWMYLIGPYDAGTVARFQPMSMRSNQALADPRGFNLDLGRTAAGTGVGVFYLYYGTQAQYGLTAADTFPVTQWLHVVLVIPSGSPSTRVQKMFVNGVLKATRTADSPTQDLLNYQLLLLAANVFDSRFYKGYLQQLTMYNYAMTDAEAIALYNSGGTPLVFMACTGTCTNAGWVKHCTTQGVMVCCPIGTFFREEIDSACQPCPAGTYSGTSASSCTLCQAGTFSLGVNQILSSACTACPSNSWSYENRTGCLANTGYYNLEDNLLAYYPFRPENIYQNPTGNGYTLTSTNGASYAPQSECMTAPFPGAGVALLDNNDVNDASSSIGRSFRVSVGAGLDLRAQIGTGTGATAGPGLTICFWSRGRDGPTTPGVVNVVDYQAFIVFAKQNIVQASSPFHYNDRVRYLRGIGSSSNTIWDIYPAIGDGSSGVSVTNAGRYTRNWIHQCAAFTGSSITTYFDCAGPTCTGTTSNLMNWPQIAFPFVYLGTSGNDRSYYGWLADVRLYKKALTPAEVYAVKSYSSTTAFSVTSGDYLLAYYPFSASNIYADASGNGYTLTSTNGASNAPTYDGTTAPFPGAGAVFMNNANVLATSGTAQTFRISAGSGFDLRAMIGTSAAPGEGFSVCFWYRAQSNTIGWLNGFYIGYTTSPTLNYIRLIRNAATSGIFWSVVSSSSGIGNDASGPYTTTWTHTCLSMTGRNWLAYYDCSSATCAGLSLSATGDVPNIMYNLLHIGQSPWDPVWYGWFSEVRLYKKALTPADVYAVRCYTGTSGFSVNKDPSLMAYYPFNQANIYADASGNGLTLTALNSGYPPAYDGSTTPFPGAGVALLDNNNVAPLSSSARSFQITMPSGGISLGTLLGTAAAPGTGFSFCAWYKGKDGPTAGTVNTVNGYQVLFSMLSLPLTTSPQTNIAQVFAVARFDVTSQISIGFRSGGSSVFSQQTAGKYTNIWTHICVSAIGQTVNVYYDCNTPSCTPLTASLSSPMASAPLLYAYIGQMWDPPWYGWLSEVRLYKKALSAAEVFAVKSYGSTTPSIYGNNVALLAYYPFNQGNIYADASGNENGLAAVNAGSPPTFDSTVSKPFPGAGVVYFANSGGASIPYATSQGFTMNVGTGINLGSLIGTSSVPAAGFSVCFWLKGADGATAGTVNSINAQNIITFMTGTSSPTSRWRLVRATTGNTLGFDHLVSGANGGGTSLSNIYSNVWVHHCYTFQGKAFKAYFGCSSSTCAPSIDYTMLVEWSASVLYTYVTIGQGAWDTGFFGWLSEVRYYKKALTPAEVFAIKSYDGTSPTAVNSVNNGLLAYYPFHPNAFLVDASGVTGSLTNTGSVASQAGSLTDLQNVAYFAQPGGVAKASASIQYLTIPSITLGRSLSLCLWYNPDSATSTGLQSLFFAGKGSGGSFSDDINIRRDAATNNIIVQFLTGTSSMGALAYSGMYQYNVWQHLCVTVSGTSGVVYYNGVAHATTMTFALQKATVTYTNQAFLGGHLGAMTGYTQDYLRGQLDEVRIYSRAISAAEVASIYNFRSDTYTPSVVMKCDTSSCAAGTTTGYCLPSGAVLCCGINQFFRPGVDSSCQNCPLYTFSPDGGLTACRACSTSPVILSSQVTSFDVPGYRVFAFSSFSYPGLTFLHDTSVDVLLVGGGGAGGMQSSGGGGAGAVLFYPGAVLSASTTYQIVHGVGGGAVEPVGVTGTDAYIRNTVSGLDLFKASGGAGGGYWNMNLAASGGSGGGAGGCALGAGLCVSNAGGGVTSANVVNGVTGVAPGSTGLSRYVQGNSGGMSSSLYSSNEAVHGGGGGGAGAKGGDQFRWNSNCAAGQLDSCGRCGFGGDGVAGVTLDGVFYNFTTIFGSAYTSRSQSGFVGGGGGGGGYSSYGIIKCNGGKGGGGAGYKTTTAGYAGETGLLGTGGGGGGSNHNTYVGGAGGRGMILIRAPAVCVCPVGTYSNVNGCAACPAGTYTTGTGFLSSAACVACLAGTYSSGSGTTIASTCQQCSAGKYSSGLGMPTESTCTGCGAGTFAASDGNSACALCTQAKYSTAIGAIGCNSLSTCSAGSYSSGLGLTAQSCTACGAGTYRPIPAAMPWAPTGWLSSTDALRYWTGDNHVTDYSNCRYLQMANAQPAYQCDNGYLYFWLYIWFGHWNVNNVGSNWYTDSGASASCPGYCQSGEYEPMQSLMPKLTGMSYCLSCSSSTICQAGSYASSACVVSQNVICTTCPTGTYSVSAGLSVCTPCPAGTYSVTTGASSSGVCLSCAAGSYGLSGASACTPCAAGTYGLSAGLSVCTPCSAGKYSASTSASVSSVCLSCTTGTFNAATGGSSAAACGACTAGTYTGMTASSACTSCPLNSNSGSGASVCTANAGYYNLDSSLRAYYTFNPGELLRDTTGVTGFLSPSASSPTSQQSGPFGASSYSAFLTGSASSMAANNQFFQLPSLTLPNDVSICSWFWISSSITRGYNRVFDFGAGMTANVMVNIRGGSNVLETAIYDETPSLLGTSAVSDGATPVNTWKHVCVILSGSSGNFWINNIGQSFTLTRARNVNTALSSSFIGRSNWASDYYWYGAIDEFRIYTKALSSSEVSALYSFRGDTYSPMIILQCLPCAAGSYGQCLSTGGPSCTTCSAGTYSTGTGMITSATCQQCSAGSYSAAGVSACTPCTAGTYTGMSASSACTPCPANSNSGSGVSVCTANTGYYNMDTNLKAYYTFNPGELLRDTTGVTGYLMASASSPTSQATGPFGVSSYSTFLTGSASTVAANNQYFTLPSLTLPNDMTICAWFWISPSITRTWNRIWDFGLGAGTDNVFATVYGATSDLNAGVFRGTTRIAENPIFWWTNGASVSTWKHTCLTLSGTAGNFWLDNSPKTFTMTDSRNAAVVLTSNYIGRSNWVADYYWYGAIDEFRIYTKALSSSEVSALYSFRGDTYSPMIILQCPPCPSGQYGACLSSGALSCTSCSAGSFSTGTGMITVATCQQCGAGTYSGAGAGACTGCVAGTYSGTLGAIVSTVCLACGAGTYSASSGASSIATCTSCGAGTYSGNTGASLASACTACSAGTYSSALGATAIAICTACGTGTYSTGLAMTSIATCTSCGAGTFSASTGASLASACTACVAGSYSGATGVSVCILCGAGTYSTVLGATLIATCQGCVAGTYSTSQGLPASASCVRCGAGTYSTGTGMATALACQSCAAGTYSSGTGLMGTCTLCSAGTYSTVLGAIAVSTCQACQAGTYSTGLGSITSTVCQSCSAGTYSSGTGIQLPCTQCGAGTYSTVLGAIAVSTCQACPAGTYSSALGLPSQPSCTSCGSGTYSTVLGAIAISTCQACVAGTFQTGLGIPASASCTLCGAGTYSTTLGAPLASACQFCLAGTYGTGLGYPAAASCSQCGAGTYSTTLGAVTATACQSCLAGTYGTGLGYPATTSCSLCGAGTYSTTLGAVTAIACQSCLAGTYGTGLGYPAPASCSLCGAGAYSTTLGATIASACSGCPAGTFSTATGANLLGACTPCSPGTFANVTGAALASVCQNCSAGTYYTGSGAMACTFCSPGTYATGIGAANSSVCLSCAKGQYYSGIGGKACQMCQVNTYNPNTGASACQYCLAGTIAAVPGLSVCASCGPGRYSTGLGLSCTSCSAGTYSTSIVATLASDCQLCLAGTYGTGLTYPAATSCTPCWAGTYSTTLGATIYSVCLACSPGTYYTGTGASLSSTCTSCPPGTYANDTGATIASVCQNCLEGTYYTGLGATTCTPCSAGTYNSGTGAALLDQCMFCSPGTYANVTAATTASVCLNCSAGTYYTGSGTVLCTSCTAGKYATATGAINASVCLNCKAGTYYTGTGLNRPANCRDCSSGKFSTVIGSADSSSCLFCLAGTFSYSPGLTLCLYCPAGLYSTGTGEISGCIHCSLGKYSTGSGVTTSSVCLSCGAGVYSSGTFPTTCRSCVAGTYASGLQSTVCSACINGGNYASSTGSSACLDCSVCPQGSILTSYCNMTWDQTCAACSPGTVQSNALECTLCTPGTYNELSGQITCIPCNPGTYSTASGAVTSGNCALCSPGTYGGMVASTVCTSCALGKYFSSSGGTASFDVGFLSGSAVILQGPTPCMNCSGGTYARSVGASSCVQCLAGTYASSDGLSTCVACSIGSYANNTGLSGCLTCPANSNTAGTNSTQRGDCVCNPSYAGNLSDSAQTCSGCPANSYCAGLSQQACPAHTHSPALSSLQEQCRCDAGYRCTYTRVVALHFDFPESLDFTAQSGSIQTTLAAAAGVPASSVTWRAGRILILAPPPPPPPSAEF